MSTDTRIYLPAHVKTEKVFEVMQKAMFGEFEQYTFKEMKQTRMRGKRETIEIEVPFDADKPSGKDNPWHVRSKSSESKYFIKSIDNKYFQFNFHDLNDILYHCHYYFDNDESDSDMLEPGNKTLHPAHGAVWCCLGKRLVDFFGGKMLYSDAMDSDDISHWYTNDSPKMTRKKPDESPNDKWYQYQNALWNEPALSSQELLEMTEKAVLYKRDEQLVETLKKFELLQKLDKDLAFSGADTKKNKI